MIKCTLNNSNYSKFSFLNQNYQSIIPYTYSTFHFIYSFGQLTHECPFTIGDKGCCISSVGSQLEIQLPKICTNESNYIFIYYYFRPWSRCKSSFQTSCHSSGHRRGTKWCQWDMRTWRCQGECRCRDPHSWQQHWWGRWRQMPHWRCK